MKILGRGLNQHSADSPAVQLAEVPPVARQEMRSTGGDRRSRNRSVLLRQVDDQRRNRRSRRCVAGQNLHDQNQLFEPLQTSDAGEVAFRFLHGVLGGKEPNALFLPQRKKTVLGA